jgi:WD40 repeat protein
VEEVFFFCQKPATYTQPTHPSPVLQQQPTHRMGCCASCTSSSSYPSKGGKGVLGKGRKPLGSLKGEANSKRWSTLKSERAIAHASHDSEALNRATEEEHSKRTLELVRHSESLRIVVEAAQTKKVEHMTRMQFDAGSELPLVAEEFKATHAHVRALVVLDDGRVVSGSDDGLVRVFERGGGGGLELELGGHEGGVVCLAALPHGGFASGGADATIHVWEQHGEAVACARVLRGHASAVCALLALPDRRLVSGGRDGTACLWDTDNTMAHSDRHILWGHGKVGGGGGALTAAANAATTPGASGNSPEHGREDVCALAYLVEDGRVASGGMDGVIILWTLPSNNDPLHPHTTTPTISCKLTGHAGCVTALADLPWASLLASGGRDGSVRLWDITLGTCAAVLEGHHKLVQCLLVVPGEGVLLSGSGDCTVRVWKVGGKKVGGGWSALSLQTQQQVQQQVQVQGQEEDHSHALQPLVFGLKDTIGTMALLPSGKVASGGLGAHIRVWEWEDHGVKWRSEHAPSPRKSPAPSPRFQ